MRTRLIKLVAYVQLNTSGSPIIRAEAEHFNGKAFGRSTITVTHAYWEGNGIKVVKKDDNSNWPEGPIGTKVILTTKKGTYVLSQISEKVYQGSCNGVTVKVALHDLHAFVEFKNLPANGKTRTQQAPALVEQDTDPSQDLQTKDIRGISGTKCDKCKGTGIYRYPSKSTGKWKQGMCFACEGKGYLTPSDHKRNTSYWNNYDPYTR